jgi:hypothetical protein
MEIQQTIFGQPVTMYPAQNRANIFHEKVIGAKRHSAWRDPSTNTKPLIRFVVGAKILARVKAMFQEVIEDR